MLADFDSAIKQFKEALEEHLAAESPESSERDRAQALQALGYSEYQALLHKLRDKLPPEIDLTAGTEKVIDYYSAASELWLNLKEYAKVIQIYQLLGALYEVLGNSEKYLDYYNKTNIIGIH